MFLFGKPLLRILGQTALLSVSAVVFMSCAGVTYPKHGKNTVNISFVMEGVPRRLSEYRGKPVMLVLMRTSEVVSQIYMSRLKEAIETSPPKANLIVLTVEPSESPFVEEYQELEKLPFPIGVAEPGLVQGESAFGLISGIPFTYFIDANGIIVSSQPGVIETDDLLKMMKKWGA